MFQKPALCSLVDSLRPSPIRAIAEEAQRMAGQGVDVCNLTIGRPDFDTPLHIKEAAKTALDKGFVHYSSTAGELTLREAVCEYLLKNENVEYVPGEIVITMGGGEAGYVVSRALLNPGDEVLVPDPMYVYYDGWSSLSGASCIPVPTLAENDFNIDVASLEKAVNSKTKAIILTTPHNPTGQIYEKETLSQIAAFCMKHNLLVVFDNIYGRFIYDDAVFFNIAALDGMKERTIIVSSLSKTYAMDGWRIGYIAGSEWAMGAITKMHQHVVSCANTFVQKAAETALRSSQECVEEMRKEFDSRRKLVMSCLDKMNIPYPKPRGAFYVFPRIDQFGLSSIEFSHFLLHEAHLAVVPGSAFGECGEGHVRISYTISGEEILKGLSRMQEAIRKL
jgi:aminotransferase